MAMMASCYLLFRQGNAFARDVTPPEGNYFYYFIKYNNS